MRIVMTTIPFLPQIGGMETVVALLARELVKLGCEVKVVTMTPSDQKDSFPYEVIRQPDWKKLWQTWRWADAVLLQGLTIRFGWPALFIKKPCLMTHHMIFDRQQNQSKLRSILIRRCRHVSVSQAVARSLPVASEVIYNPYHATNFPRPFDTCERTRDLVFVGRLCIDKGADLLIDALELLANRNLHPSLTIVGDGEQRQKLEECAHSLGMGRQIIFTGPLSGEALAKTIQNHRIMVVPSRCKEAFGLVALEGIACGCVVVGSDGGGLLEAIGACGVTFPIDHIGILAERLAAFLKDPKLLETYRQNTESHLACHQPAFVGQKYMAAIKAALSA